MTPAPKRRWFRFGLKGLMVLVTITAVCIWLGLQINIVRQRQAMLETLKSEDAFVTSSDSMKKAFQDYYRTHPERPQKSFSISIIRRWLGDKAIVQIATFEWGHGDCPLRDEARLLFPEAEVITTASRDIPLP